MYKIRYSINLILKIGEHYVKDENNQLVAVNKGISVMGMIYNSNQIEIFECDIIKDLIKYKWEKLGNKHHMIACLSYIIYLGTFISHVYFVYIHNRDEEFYFVFGLAIGVAYPLFYEIVQLYN
jgi:hypothetical protein